METPTSIGRYRLRGEIGRGGMGVVYRAWDPELDREVACKVILFPTRVTDAERSELEDRFRREARAAASISHPGVVTVYDYGRDGDYLFLVMELVDGESLAQRMESHRYSQSEAFALVATVADALDAAHGLGIVHRDVTPRNILIARDGRVVVTDFGLARSLDEVGQTITEPGMVVGSPHYVSPERARNQGWDARSDLFSLGVILFELKQGHLPFEGTEISSVLYQVVHEDPLAALRPTGELDRQTLGLLSSCLAKLPEERIGSARRLAQEARRLEKLAQEKEAEETALVPHLHPEVRGRAPGRTRLVRWVLVALLVVSVGWWLSQRGEEELAPASGPERAAIDPGLRPADRVDATAAPPPATEPLSTVGPESTPEESSIPVEVSEGALPSADGAAEAEADPARVLREAPEPGDVDKVTDSATATIEAPDTVAPVLAVDAPLLEFESRLARVRGRSIDDRGSVELTLDGSPVAVAEDGSFSVAVPIVEGRQTLRLVARDLADNLTVRTIEIEGGGVVQHSGSEPSARSNTPPNFSRFRDRGDGSIVDDRSGIAWTKRPGPDPATLKEAKAYCRKLELARQDDWILPTIEELEELARAASLAANEGQAEVALAAIEVWSTSRQGFGEQWTYDFARRQRRVRPPKGVEGSAIRVLCLRRAQPPPGERPRPRLGPEPGGARRPQ